MLYQFIRCSNGFLLVGRQNHGGPLQWNFVVSRKFLYGLLHGRLLFLHCEDPLLLLLCDMFAWIVRCWVSSTHGPCEVSCTWYQYNEWYGWARQNQPIFNPPIVHSRIPNECSDRYSLPAHISHHPIKQ